MSTDTKGVRYGAAALGLALAGSLAGLCALASPFVWAREGADGVVAVTLTSAGLGVIAMIASGLLGVAVRAVLARVAEDERRHAEYAWELVAFCVAEGGAGLRTKLAHALAPARSAEVKPASMSPLDGLGRLRAGEEAALREQARLAAAARFTARYGSVPAGIDDAA